jgi:hypothetical protein
MSSYRDPVSANIPRQVCLKTSLHVFENIPSRVRPPTITPVIPGITHCRYTGNTAASVELCQSLY